MTARISFKGKIETVRNVDDTVAYSILRVPALERRHCDMNAFRQHPKYGGLANSDLFPGVLHKIRRDVFGLRDDQPHIRMDRIPAGVNVDATGFLATVTVEV